MRERLGRGEGPGYVEAAASVFEPGVLTIGFARRVATYKRLHLLLQRLDRGIALVGNPDRPVQVVIAGKAHPQDLEAKQTLRALFEARRAPHVGARIVYLEDYDLELAATIVAGVDVWVNVPRPPHEASGTSGMKVALNGGLNISVLDGWWIEGFDAGIGWAIATRRRSRGSRTSTTRPRYTTRSNGRSCPCSTCAMRPGCRGSGSGGSGARWCADHPALQRRAHAA